MVPEIEKVKFRTFKFTYAINSEPSPEPFVPFKVKALTVYSSTSFESSYLTEFGFV